MLFGLLFIDAVLHLISFVLIYKKYIYILFINLLEIMIMGDKSLFLEATDIKIHEQSTPFKHTEKY